MPQAIFFFFFLTMNHEAAIDVDNIGNQNI